MELEQALWGETIRTDKRHYECLISVKDEEIWFTISTSYVENEVPRVIYSLRVWDNDIDKDKWLTRSQEIVKSWENING